MTEAAPESADLLDEIENTIPCVFCAGLHDIVPGLDRWYQPCPRIKKIDRHPGGELISVEYWPPHGTWEARVAFLADAHDEDNPDAPTA